MKVILLFIFFIIVNPIRNIYAQTPLFYIDPSEIDSVRSPFRKAGIPLISDLDKNGQKEIIFFALDYNGISSPIGELYVIKSDGNNYPGFPKGLYDYPLDIASGDVDGDGFLDIALRYTYSIDVIDRFGNHLQGFPVNYSDGGMDPIKFLSLYDLDNNGKLEIIVSKIGEICVFNFDGTIRTGWPRYISGTAKYNPAIGDIDNDGSAEIITTSFRTKNNYIDSGAITVFKNNGSIFPGNWPLKLDSNYHSWSSSPSLYIDKIHSSSTFILVALDHTANGSTDHLHKFLKLDISGNALNVSYHIANQDYGTLVIGDLNRNNTLEFCTGTEFGNTLTALNENLTVVDGWPQLGVGEHEATALIGKLTYNNELNITNNRWSADNGFGYILAYSPKGSRLPWSPLRPIGLVSAISLADLNNDGSVELISTSTRTGFETFLNIWTIPGIPYTKEDFPWPQYGHDRYRTNQYGFVPPDDPVGIQPISRSVPEKFNLYQNYPNPFNPTTNIKFDLKNPGEVKLKIFDELGREVETLIKERLKPGTYSLTFNGSKYTTGVYFYRLITDNTVETKKMLLVK